MERPNKKMKILVIDDAKDLLQMVQRILELDGYQVYAAPDGESGLELMDQCQPDLVLLDIMMPGIDGTQVLEIIRKRSRVPVIMLTGKSDIVTVRDVFEMGADDYMTKPFGAKELLARIKAKMRRIKPNGQNETLKV